jgi:small acid-soluble spore protein I (minor)
MNTDIRGYIKNNFKDGNKEEIQTSIEQSIQNNDEITLPGLGVFFEILWNASDDECKEKMLNMLSENLKEGK